MLAAQSGVSIVAKTKPSICLLKQTSPGKGVWDKEVKLILTDLLLLQRRLWWSFGEIFFFSDKKLWKLVVLSFGTFKILIWNIHNLNSCIYFSYLDFLKIKSIYNLAPRICSSYWILCKYPSYIIWVVYAFLTGVYNLNSLFLFVFSFLIRYRANNRHI